MVNACRPQSEVKGTSIEGKESFMTLRKGQMEDFHFIRPEDYSERMRMVGALGEMLLEEATKAFGAKSLVLVAEGDDSRLLMFPEDGGFVVWRTALDLHEAISALRRRRSDGAKPDREKWHR